MSTPHGYRRQIGRVKDAFAGRKDFGDEASRVVDDAAGLSTRGLPLLVNRLLLLLIASGSRGSLDVVVQHFEHLRLRDAAHLTRLLCSKHDNNRVRSATTTRISGKCKCTIENAAL